nr:hypothetical protein [Mycobacterium cookii]
MTSTAKRFANYEQKTDRELPVIRLRTQPQAVGPGRQHHSTGPRDLTNVGVSRWERSDGNCYGVVPAICALVR